MDRKQMEAAAGAARDRFSSFVEKVGLLGLGGGLLLACVFLWFADGVYCVKMDMKKMAMRQSFSLFGTVTAGNMMGAAQTQSISYGKLLERSGNSKALAPFRRLRTAGIFLFLTTLGGLGLAGVAVFKPGHSERRRSQFMAGAAGMLILGLFVFRQAASGASGSMPDMTGSGLDVSTGLTGAAWLAFLLALTVLAGAILRMRATSSAAS